MQRILRESQCQLETFSSCPGGWRTLPNLLLTLFKSKTVLSVREGEKKTSAPTQMLRCASFPSLLVLLGHSSSCVIRLDHWLHQPYWSVL